MVRAFWEEFQPCLRHDASLASRDFCKLATRLATTGHENRLSSHLASFDISTDIPVTYLDVGLAHPHPTLAVADFVKALDVHKKIDALLFGNRVPQYEDFWRQWKQIQPNHPIYELHRENLGYCIPVAIHADEGTSVLKKALMVLAVQPLLGRGSRKRKADAWTPGLNFLGNSLVTRFLFSVMLAKLYSGKKSKNGPLLALVKHLCKQLRSLFLHGCTVKIDGSAQHVFLVPLALKGDWPALAKLGRLVRHHGRLTYNTEKGKGICHLCQGGMEGHAEWFDTSYNTMLAMRAESPAPWNVEPDLTRLIPMDPSCKANFLKIDVFHTCHKGFLADLAANIIVPCLWKY